MVGRRFDYDGEDPDDMEYSTPDDGLFLYPVRCLILTQLQILVDCENV